MKPIRSNDRGERVLDVQARLGALGYEVPADERGAFGEHTERAVRAFQDARGLHVDGIVGPDTWRSLVEASWKLGDRVLYLRSPYLLGDDVRELQDRLTTLGFDVWRTDGIFGTRTMEAVIEFQRNVGVPADGIVAASTIRALTGLPRITGDTPSASIREREALRARPGTVTGLRIVLDPGHGGSESGFVGSTGAREADVCFAIARLAEAALAAAGAQVYLSRSTHDSPDAAVRTTLANVLDADVYLALHTGGDRAGAGAHYFGHERYASEAGRHLASLLLDETSGVGFASRGATPKTFAILRDTRMPAVFLEIGTITDPGDEKLLTDAGSQARLAEAIARAIVRYARDPVAG